MAIEILDGISEAREWRELLQLVAGRGGLDIYFQPEYAALHRFREGTRALLFAYRETRGLWLYPFLLQPIESVGGHSVRRGWFDIESPYGYVGPLASADEPEFLDRAHEAFTEWCESAGVVAEFARLHPLLLNERWVDPRMEVVYDRETVSLNLQGFDALGQDQLPFDKMTRYMLRRAEGSGLKIEASAAEERFEQFVALYKRTMQRLEADRYYYFSEEYFAGLRRLIKESGWLLAATVEDEGAGASLVAAALFLKGGPWLHYHLSATDPERRLPGATNLLLCEAARRGSREGFELLHLGGGISRASDDSLLKFKRKMATGAHAFRIGKRIHQPRAYTALKQMWAEAHPELVEKYGARLLCYRCET